MKNRTLFIILLLAAIELFARLGSGILYFDEAIYAQVSKEIIESGDWLTLHWNGHDWFQKPPGYFWATAILFRLFDVSEFWARAPSALSGIGVILISYLIARRLYNHAAGVLAAFILLSSELFIFNARFGTTDTMLTFFMFLAVYGYLRAEDDERWWLLACVSCGLTLMVKGAAGVIAPIALILAALLDGRARSAFRSKWLWASLACASLTVIPWHVLMLRLHGNSFVNGYLLQNVVDRAKGNLNEYQRGYGYYLRVLWDFYSPWVYVLPFALIFGRTPRSKIILILAALVMCLYTLVQTKFQWYIVPAVPALSVIIAGFIIRSMETRSLAQRRFAIFALTMLWFAGSAAVISRILLPNTDMESGARLAKLAAHEEGGIVAYPENLEMTVRFYSGRKLCTDSVLSTLSHSTLTECYPGEATHIILRTTELAKIQTRFTVEPLAEDGQLQYARITPKEGNAPSLRISPSLSVSVEKQAL
jgi:4-amino-4-deoxy-L-arabinose transferase-like glycosyltransferase